MLAMVGLVAGVLIIAGAGSLILTRNAARNQAEQQLVAEADALTKSGIGSQSLKVLHTVRATLKLEDADVIQIDRLGTVLTALPDGVTQNDIDVSAVQSGQTTSGRHGGLVYAVAPVTLSPELRSRIERRTHRAFEGTFAVLLTRDVGDLGPSWGYFIISGGVALLVAALVAWQTLTPDGATTGRSDDGDRTHRVRRIGESCAGPPPRLSRVHLACGFYQRYGAELGGRPRP